MNVDSRKGFVVRSTIRASRMATACALLCGLIVSSAGCVTRSKEQAKQQAQQQWNSMRASVMRQLAARQCHDGLFQECAKTATEAIALDPTQGEGYALLVESSLELSRLASAQTALNAAAHAGVQCADLEYLRGVVAEIRDDQPAALGHYQAARSLQPDHLDALVAQVEILVESGRRDEAVSLLNESTSSNSPATLAVLAAFVSSSGTRVQAAATAQLGALYEVQSDVALATEMVTAWAKAGRCELAASIHERMSPVDGAGDVRLVRDIAACYLREGHAGLAEQVLREWVPRYPHDPQLQLLLAKALVSRRDWAGASEALLVAESSLPGNVEVLLTRAFVEFRQGDLASARSRLVLVLQLQPDDVEARCLLGEVLLLAGDMDGARQQFAYVNQRHPEGAWAAAGLMRTGVTSSPAEGSTP